MRPREHYQFVPMNSSDNLEHFSNLIINNNNNFEEINENNLFNNNNNNDISQRNYNNNNMDDEDKDEDEDEDNDIPEDEEEDEMDIPDVEDEDEVGFIDDIFYETPSVIDMDEEDPFHEEVIIYNRNPYRDTIFRDGTPGLNPRYPTDSSTGSSSRSRNRGNQNDKTNLESPFWEAAEFILNYIPIQDLSFTTHPLSFLQPGRTFTGSQNLISDSHIPVDKEKWEVKVVIHSTNPEQGTIVGLMEALNVPSTATTVITYWEGEIIDFVNFTMRTKKWSADSEVDLFHWKMFQPFKNYEDQSEDYLQNIYRNYIFMRWKEKFFVNVSPTESGLTIAGFYYICIRRIDGHIEGLYYEPGLTPFQKLSLQPTLQGNGLNFSEYAFA